MGDPGGPSLSPAAPGATAWGVSSFLHGLTPSKCRCERAPGRKVERHAWDYLRQNRDFSACFGRFSGRIAWKNLAAACASAKQAAARTEQANGKDRAWMKERKALVAKRYELPAGSPISRRCKRRSTASKLYRVVRNRKILQDHQNGISARALFDPYMLSERQIWDILAEGKREKTSRRASKASSTSRPGGSRAPGAGGMGTAREQT